MLEIDTEMVRSHRYHAIHLNNKLAYSENINPVYTKGQNRLYLLRRLSSFWTGTPIDATVREYLCISGHSEV